MALPPSLLRQESGEALLDQFHERAWDPTGEDREQQQQAAAFVEQHGLHNASHSQQQWLRQWTKTAEESTFVFVVSATSSLGGFLFGFTSAVVSGVLYMPEFSEQMGIDSSSPKTSDVLKQAAVSVMFALLAALGSAPCVGGAVADCIGRRLAIVSGGVIVAVAGFITAAAGLTCNTPTVALAILYLGRALSGFAIGLLCAAVPLYQSEIAPIRWRGSITTFFQLSITLGILCVTVVNLRMTDVRGAWMWIFALQALPAVLLVGGAMLLPDSPRWLLLRRRADEAERSLRQLRHADRSDAVYAEYTEMRRQIADEDRASDRDSALTLDEDSAAAEIRVSNHTRRCNYCCVGISPNKILLASTMMALQQLVGINVVLYYGPSLFTSLLSNNMDDVLGLQALYGAVNVLGTLVPIAIVDCVGRRALLISGACIMCICLSSLAILSKLYDEHVYIADPCLPAAFVLVFVFVFASTWGPVPWLVCAEIFVTKSRATGVAVASVTNWSVNILVSLFSLFFLDPKSAHILPGPTGLGDSLVLAFSVLAVMSAVALVFSIFFVPETMGRDHERATAGSSLIGSAVALQRGSRQMKRNTETATTASAASGAERALNDGAEAPEVGDVNWQRRLCCCRKRGWINGITHSVVALDVYAVTLLLIDYCVTFITAVSSAKEAKYSHMMALGLLWPLTLLMNYILLLLFYTRDWWLMIVLWKGFLSFASLAACVTGIIQWIQDAADHTMDAYDLNGITDKCATLAYGVYAAFTFLFAVLFTRSRRFKQQWRRHLPAKIFPRFTRQHIDDGFIAFDEFDVFEDQCIGSGGEARVFRGEWAQIDVAVRQIFLGPSSEAVRERRFREFKSEVRLMKQLVHPSIASFFGCSLYQNYLYMILELGSCSMRAAITHYQPKEEPEEEGSGWSIGGTSSEPDIDGGFASPRLALSTALRWALEIADGMLYLHEHRLIAHLDLKPENILLHGAYNNTEGSMGGSMSNSRSRAAAAPAVAAEHAHLPTYEPEHHYYSVRICDFGLAQRLKRVELRSSRTARLMRQGSHTHHGLGGGGGGTLEYMPPEAIQKAFGGGGQRAPRSRVDEGEEEEEEEEEEEDAARATTTTARSPILRQLSSVERSMAADVYAFGIILWELITCEVLYPDARGLAFFVDKVGTEGGRPPLPNLEICDEATAALMVACWSAKPSARPRFREIVRALQDIIARSWQAKS